MQEYNEKMMERLNSGELKTILWKHFPTLSSLVWRQVEGKHGRRSRKQEKISILYWSIRNKKFLISELFNVIQDAISLILLYRTMYLFRTTSSSTFIMSDVQSIYIPSSIRDWHREDKNWATGRQFSFCLWIPWIKKTQGSWYDRLECTASCTIHA